MEEKARLEKELKEEKTKAASEMAAYPDLYVAVVEQFKRFADFQMAIDAVVASNLAREGAGGAGLSGATAGGRSEDEIVLDNGLTVAVKRLESFENGSRKSVKRRMQQDVESIARLRDRNLMSLRAFVREPNRFSLVYNYIPNGSLEDAMNRVRENQLELNWETRLRISVGIVKGLQDESYQQSL
ncbi:inactive leucine-rich repeat receptor-like protein kinase CORYNE [Camellia sinensis]|uniref:inactive leucine-rich repeat receptor-like protein kinase CORYNE n=1 Tax=Camellia sinensis TaxID=4442 RepID=UPI001035F088|nr:inactive leucine-rich repeat receptor-like protein kinase CORYNE [Camellia sinensis]